MSFKLRHCVQMRISVLVYMFDTFEYIIFTLSWSCHSRSTGNRYKQNRGTGV